MRHMSYGVAVAAMGAGWLFALGVWSVVADGTAMDRGLIDGVFVGGATPAEPLPSESVRLYQGPLPEDRDPAFWDLAGDHRGNAWFKDWLTEAHVMRALMRHYDSAGRKDWEIGIGTGGQLYSWQGPWGEALPPQFGPWVDEVWQSNFHSSEAQKVLDAIYEYDPRESNMHNTIGRAFVQASASLHYDAEPGKGFFPSPMVAQWYDAANMAYTTVNLALSPGLPTLIYHNILTYHRYRYVGEGVIEVTVVAYNFGEWAYPYGGIPWGGIRTTTFPDLYVSHPDGSYGYVEQYYGEAGCGRTCEDADGWLLATAEGDDPRRSAFAFIYGRDFPYEKIQTDDPRPALMTFGRAGRTADGSPNSRAATIMANSVRGIMRPGEEYWVRYYLAAGPCDQVLENARKYGGQGDYGILNFTEERASTHPLYRTDLPGGSVVLSRTGKSSEKPVCRVYNEPVRGSMPLFTIRELPAGKGIVTTDIYELSRREKYISPVPSDHEMASRLAKACKSYVYESENLKPLKWELLGFVMPASGAAPFSSVPTGDVGRDRVPSSASNEDELRKASPAAGFAPSDHSPRTGRETFPAYRETGLEGTRSRAGYVNLATIIDGPGTRGMLALGPGTVDYESMTIGKPKVDGNTLTVDVTVEITNHGREAAIATPRLYVSDLEASVPVPSLRYAAGRNILLQPGENAEVSLVVDGEALSVVDQAGAQVVEPGAFALRLGPAALDVRQEGRIEIAEGVTLKQGPAFDLTELELPTRVEANQSFTVSTTVRNSGEMRGSHDVVLSVDGQRVNGRNVHLPPGGSTSVAFSTMLFEAGEHEVRMGNRSATIHVSERPATFVLSPLTVSDDVVYVGDSVTVTATVTNLGSVAGEKRFELNANGKTLEERTVSIPAAPGGAGKELQFGVRFAEAGLRTLDIDGGAPVDVLVLDRIEAPLAEYATTDAKMGRYDDAFLIAVKGGDVFESVGESNDAFGAIVSPEVAGDFSATVRVDAQGATFPYAKAGLMVRNSLAKRSEGYAAMCVTPERGVLFLYDSNRNGILDRPTGVGDRRTTVYPVWLRLEKRGGVVSGLYSADGTSWKRLASAEVPGVADVQQVGMFASAYNLTRSGRVSFSRFDIAQPVEPLEADRPTALVGALAPPVDAVPVKVITGSDVKPEILGVNLALNPDVVPTASSGYGNRLMFTPQCAIDGDKRTDWVSRAEGSDAWLELDLGRRMHITHIGYQSRGNMADWVTSFTITAEDGAVQECRMVEKHMKRMQYFDIKDVATRYLRWDALESVTGNTGIKELAVFGVPVEDAVAE